MKGLAATVAVLGLAAVACAGRTPSPETRASPRADVALERFTDESVGERDCWGFRVRWFNPTDDAGEIATLVVTDPEGDLVLMREADDAFARLIPLWCGDLTGDGAAELGYEHFSGGAHCCTYVEVISLLDPDNILLGADFGNAGPPEPQQLDGGDALELVGHSDVFAYFELSFAVSPFIPIVYGFDGSRFVVVTDAFPEVVHADIDEHLERAEELRVEGAPTDALQGVALGIYGNHLILGDADGGIARVREELPEAADWLGSIADDARRHFEATYGADAEPELPA